MKFLGISLSLLSIAGCSAFAPSNMGVSRTPALNAKTLEGWKVNGLVKPANNFILIKKTEDESETESGILLSNQVRSFLNFSMAFECVAIWFK